MVEITNLNDLGIETDGWDRETRRTTYEPLLNFGMESVGGLCQAYFKDLEDHLIAHIRRARAVVGCVAWLTSEPILTALASCEAVSIIVQKEDFLRPDGDSPSAWKRRLREMYEALPSNLSRYSDFGDTVLDHMSYACSPTIQAVRCVGNHNSSKSPSFPRSHHKFVVFCDRVHLAPRSLDYGSCRRYGKAFLRGERCLQPYAVWTGSFNFTATAGRSFENAVLIRDHAIVEAYFQEYTQVAALSEPLDWTSEWCQPEWRIGS